MFVRTKKIKGKQYAYLVENEWTPWGSRQKVNKYLGRAHTLERHRKEESALPEGYYNAVREALLQELRNHGFEERGESQELDDIKVDLDRNIIEKRGRKAVIAMNEGYLCEETLRELMDFKPDENKEKTIKELAMKALEAGLNLSQEQMLKLFEEAHK